MSLLMLCMQAMTQSFTKSEIARMSQQAQQVSIIRDNWGVPHIYGNTDADCLFGFAYAQAEDNFNQLMDNYILSLGRGAELKGEKLINDDFLTHAFQLPEKAAEDYKAAPTHMKKLYDAFAAGINYYIALKKPRLTLINRVEPWYPIAALLYKYYILEFVQDAGINKKYLQIDTTEWKERSNGSNQWAVNGPKCQDAKSLLFINPHVDFFGFGTFTEAHIISKEGWNFSGLTRIGFLLPYMGHNEHLGWGFTDNYTDKGDMYTEVFDNPANELLYKWGNEYKLAIAWQKTILIKSDAGWVKKKIKFRKTHHGPILASFKNFPLAVRLPKYDEVCQWYDQYYAMTKAKDMRSFRKALDIQALPYMNIAYADDQGNIFYLYNSLIPKRDSSFSWRMPVDGSNPKTEWMGYHPIAELPQVLNPTDHFIQNCNSSPFFTTNTGNPVKSDFPKYMIGFDLENARSKRSKEILTNHSAISFEKWQSLVTDQKVWIADSIIKKINNDFLSYEKSNKDSAALIKPLVDTLNNWDKVSRVQSVAMTIFEKAFRNYLAFGNFPKSLLKARRELEKDWGTWQVPFGEINRHQRIHWSMEEDFSDAKASLPVAGGRSAYGTIFCYETTAVLTKEGSGNKRRYGYMGNSYVSAIEFRAGKVRAVSILPFGQSEDPASKHHMDQSELYVNGQFKNAWFYKEDVEKHAERIYHPGE